MKNAENFPNELRFTNCSIGNFKKLIEKKKNKFYIDKFHHYVWNKYQKTFCHVYIYLRDHEEVLNVIHDVFQVIDFLLLAKKTEKM